MVFLTLPIRWQDDYDRWCNTDGSALFTTSCTYAGPTNTLDDCGNVNAGITNGGAMVGASCDFGTGFTIAGGYAAGDTDMATGLMTKETLMHMVLMCIHRR